MKQTIGIGIQDFEKIRTRNIFYVDKTDFIREWWGSNDDVTLITRPRRFGKTLNMSMTEQFFSLEYAGRYQISSNRESGFGRYDVMLVPEKKEDAAYILEFKVRDREDEKSLSETVEEALRQIEEKKYEEELLSRGIEADRIKKYGFAFEGKEVLIG